jgi:hypothetical protein
LLLAARYCWHCIAASALLLSRWQIVGRVLLAGWQFVGSSLVIHWQASRLLKENYIAGSSLLLAGAPSFVTKAA